MRPAADELRDSRSEDTRIAFRHADTSRFVAEPLVLKRQGDIVSLRYLQGLNVGCELRITGQAHETCVAQVRADNSIAGDVKLNLEVTKACKRVAKGERLQLGVPVLIADGRIGRTGRLLAPSSDRVEELADFEGLRRPLMARNGAFGHRAARRRRRHRQDQPVSWFTST